ncbi:MAG: signal peptidase I [Planctomycetota bacterium]
MVARTLRTGVLLAALVLATQTFVALGWLRPVVVAGDSMSPTLEAGQRITVLRARPPRRWDAVVLRSPTDANRLVVKRLVGLPGEAVTFRDGTVLIDGERRNPPARLGVYYGALGNPTWRPGPDEGFVVGDNPLVSIDSRNWDHAAGVPMRLVVGVVAE